MTNVNQCDFESLSDDQIHELVRVIIDGFGIGLSGDELDESIGVVIENVPGLEMASRQTIHRLYKVIRRKYHVEIKDI